MVLRPTICWKSGKFAEAEALLVANTNRVAPEAFRVRAAKRWTLFGTLRVGIRLMRTGCCWRRSGSRFPIPPLMRWNGGRRAAPAAWMIDGTKFYFRREPQNIFCSVRRPKKRRAKAATSRPNPLELTGHLKAVVEGGSKPAASSALIHNDYHTLTIRSNATGVKAGSLGTSMAAVCRSIANSGSVKLISATARTEAGFPRGGQGRKTGHRRRNARSISSSRSPTRRKATEFKLVF